VIIDPLTTYTVTRCPNGTTLYENLLHSAVTAAESRLILESAGIFKPVHFSLGAVFDADRTQGWDYGALHANPAGNEMDYAPTWYQTDACWVAVEKNASTGCVTYHITKAEPFIEPPIEDCSGSNVRIWEANGIITHDIDIFVGSPDSVPLGFPASGFIFSYEQQYGSSSGSTAVSPGIRVWGSAGIIANGVDIFVGIPIAVPVNFPGTGIKLLFEHYNTPSNPEGSLGSPPCVRVWDSTGIIANGIDIFIGLQDTVPAGFPMGGIILSTSEILTPPPP
jgi:hypothetical protein